MPRGVSLVCQKHLEQGWYGNPNDPPGLVKSCWIMKQGSTVLIAAVAPEEMASIAVSSTNKVGERLLCFTPNPTFSYMIPDHHLVTPSCYAGNSIRRARSAIFVWRKPIISRVRSTGKLANDFIVTAPHGYGEVLKRPKILN